MKIGGGGNSEVEVRGESANNMVLQGWRAGVEIRGRSLGQMRMMIVEMGEEEEMIDGRKLLQ